MENEFDVIILGAGIYGLYAAKILAERKQKVAVVDVDSTPFQRASYINQARVHNGYHYPRSYSTAVKSAHYYERFKREFAFSINNNIEKIYATSHRFSLVSGDQFEAFCKNVKIPYTRIDPRLYFVPNMVDAAFQTQECSFDAQKICEWFKSTLVRCALCTLYLGRRPQHAEIKGNRYSIELDEGTRLTAPTVLNATYAGINQVLDLFGFNLFAVKYEICEIIRCSVNASFQNVGITVMDGPFFSLMPFGLTGEHSLSAVTLTPHKTSHEALPTFNCQKRNPRCTPRTLENCNQCPAQPETAWKYMLQLIRKYLVSSLEVTRRESLFAIKAIPAASEIDDSRPTIIKKFSENPTFLSVWSGKINAIYDLDSVLS